MSRRAFNSIFNDSEFSLEIKENHFCSNMNFISFIVAILSMTTEGVMENGIRGLWIGFGEIEYGSDCQTSMKIGCLIHKNSASYNNRQDNKYSCVQGFKQSS